MKQTVNQWKKEFAKGVWLWIGLSLPVFVVARLFAWEIIGHRLVTAFHLENASDLITSLIGAVLLIAIVAAMAWYFRRSFNRYFEQGYAQLLSQVETERDSHLNLLEGMPAMTWRADESGKRLYCNQRWLEFTGRDAVGSSGEEWLSIIHDEDRPTYYSKTQKSMAAGHTFSMEYRARRYDGQYRWIREHDRPLRDAHGQLRGYVGVCFDITEEQQTIHRLKESEERFRAMIESTPDGVIAHREGRIIFLNQTMCTLLGIPGEKEAIGESVLKFVASEQHALVTERIQRRIAGETHFPPMELQLVRFDGSQIDSEITATVVGMDGQPAILVFVRDISERKHVDQRLAEEAIRRRILIEGSRDGIVVLREDGSVYESNQSFADLLGYTLEEIGHQHVWDWDLTWSAEELRESLREADAEGRFFETRSLRKDGSFIDVEISTNAADWNGQKLIFCTCRDISQRKRAELSLRESERVLASLMNNLPGMAFRRKLHPERALEFASGGS